MAKQAMDNVKFEGLLGSINMQTDAVSKKCDMLYDSRGYFSAQQAARILYGISNAPDKLRAVNMLEPRLCRMTCSEARDVLGAISVHNDKHVALHAIKRYLTDVQTREGTEQVLSAFVFEDDKMMALRILNTVRSDVADLSAAGGHQGYAALGGLYTQCRPLVPHLYGSVERQETNRPGKGKIEIPVTAQPGVVPSMYTGHPSYAYPPGRDYALDRGYSTFNFSTEPAIPSVYPAGAPPLGHHSGAPAPTGYPGLKSAAH